MEDNKRNIDWLAVENEYRPNILSLRAIAEKYGCTEGAIRKKAKQEGWVRNLSEKIKIRADDLVRREAVRNSTQNEKEIIDANAQNNAAIQIKQRDDVAKLRTIADRLVDQLENQESFVGKVDCLKKLTESTKSLIELERKVNKIDGDESGGTFEDWLRKQPRE